MRIHPVEALTATNSMLPAVFDFMQADAAYPEDQNGSSLVYDDKAAATTADMR